MVAHVSHRIGLFHGFNPSRLKGAASHIGSLLTREGLNKNELGLIHRHFPSKIENTFYERRWLPDSPPTFEFLVFSLKMQAEMRMGLVKFSEDQDESPIYRRPATRSTCSP